MRFLKAALTESSNGGRYRRYMLVLLAGIYAFNNVDRAALGLAVQNIKAALQLTDAQLGLLSGIVFALFYSTFGIPLGRWADRGNRIKIISLTAALGGMMIMLCGAARSFGQLMLIRIGVAVGESGCMPPAYSLIADYFGRSERPRATAKYLLGGSVSVFFGYFVAGWLNEFYGWRVMFVVLGCPCLLLSAVAWVTLHEPRSMRHRSADTGSTTVRTPPLAEVSRSLWSNRTYRCVLLTLCLNYLFGTGIGQWQPAYFIRSFGLSTGELGTWLALLYGVGGFAATYLGGYVASKYAPRNERLQLRVMALLNAGFGLISAAAYLSRNPYVALVLVGVAGSGGALQSAPLFATTQTVVPERMRAISVSILFLFANLIGMGLGPLAVGVMSDALRPVAGEESLRYALLAMCPGYLVGCWLLWRAGVTVDGDTQSAVKQTRRGQSENINSKDLFPIQ